MGTIATYTDLQNAIIEWLGRDQDTTLIARVPTFIQTCEAKLNRTLFVRQMDTRVTTLTTSGVTDCEYIALPPDFQSMRRIRLTSVTGRPVLDFMTMDQLEQYRASEGDVPDQPAFYTIFGSEIELSPVPDGVYTVEMVYRQNLPALASNATNWLLSLAPDLYLYGSLLESAPWMKEDPRVQTWLGLYEAWLTALNTLQFTSDFNGGSLQVRPEPFAVR